MNTLKTFWFWRREKTTALAKAFDKYIWHPIVLGLNWVWGFPGAVVYNYRRQRAIDQQMDNLTDYGFLDRIDKDA